VIFLLILFPFTFIEFFYAPWMEARNQARAPRALPEGARGYVILTNFDPVSRALIRKLDKFQYNYALLVPDLSEALRLHDRGYKVVVGDVDSPATYERLQIEYAALVAATSENDAVNTNIAFTVRESSEHTPVVTVADSPASVDILELAGSQRVLQLSAMLGQSLARRARVGSQRAHVVGNFNQLLVAEAGIHGTDLEGRTLAETPLSSELGIHVIGVWERGVYEHATHGLRLSKHSVLVLAGGSEQFARFNERYGGFDTGGQPVLIIGGGRVGQAAAQSLAARGVDYRIVEKDPAALEPGPRHVIGDAARLEILEEAGINEAPAVLVTTRDDDVNIYLTIYCRRLRPDIQIISRSTMERNISTLHRAGADFVMSLASLGANTIFNLLKRSDVQMIAEGLDAFRVTVPPGLADKSLVEADIRARTGCTVVATCHAGELTIAGPDTRLSAGDELILIGTIEAEDAFLREFA
jgi:Trk K+ transport system NAD-binding subunit